MGSGPEGRTGGRSEGPGLEDRLGRAVDYLEERLDGELGAPVPRKAAAAAGWSEYHFMRRFRAALGMSVAEYVRRRRLSLAALALTRGDASILEIAVEAGYESQAAFSRAFARELGRSPSSYRRAYRLPPEPASSPPPLPPGFIPPIEPRLPFEPPQAEVRVAELGALDLLGIAAPSSSARAYRAFSELPRHWEDWFRRKRWRELPGAAPGAPCYGLCSGSAGSEVEYLICLEAPPGAKAPPGWRRARVPAGRYAISEARGPQPRAIQGAILAAYARWLPGSGLARGAGWDVEVYYPGPSGRCELRMPLAPGPA